MRNQRKPFLLSSLMHHPWYVRVQEGRKCYYTHVFTCTRLSMEQLVVCLSVRDHFFMITTFSGITLTVQLSSVYYETIEEAPLDSAAATKPK